MSNLYRGPSIDVSYQVSYHLAKWLQRKSCFRNRPIRNKNCLWWPCLLMDQNGMSNSHRGPSIDASYHVSVHLAKLLQSRRVLCSSDPKGHVSYCHHWASVRPLTFNQLLFNQLLWSHWANLNQTLVEWSLDGPLPKLCPVIPTSNQDGRQSRNRKRGDEILIAHCCFSTSQNELKF
jgi:hypothetical protein